MRLDHRTEKIIVNAMIGLRGAHARERAAELAERFQVSIATVYRITSHLRRRKRRSDRVTRDFSTITPDDPFWFAAGLSVALDMKAELAATLAAANDKPLDVSTGSFQRQLREAGISRRQVRSHRRPARSFEAARPNQMWQLDFTRSAQFYIADDGGIATWGVGERKNIEKRKGHPLWIATVVDDHSRARYRRAYPGNRAVYTLDFIGRACAAKEDYRHPMHGRPATLYTDNDPVIWNEMVLPALETLGIEIEAHLPVRRGHDDAARATGKVERQFRDLKEDEKISQIRKWESLDIYNEWLLQLDIAHGNAVHSSTGQQPFARWSEIMPHELRQMPREEIFERLFRQQRTGKLDAFLRLSVAGRMWQLPYETPWTEIAARGQALEYFTSPKNPDVLWAMADGVEHKIAFKAPRPDAYGEIKAAPETNMDRAKKALSEFDYSGIKIPMPLDGKDVPAWVPRAGRGEEFDEAAVPSPPQSGVNRVAATRKLQDAGVVQRPLTPEDGAWLDAVFMGRAEIPEGEMAEMLRKRKVG